MQGQNTKTIRSDAAKKPMNRLSYYKLQMSTEASDYHGTEPGCLVTQYNWLFEYRTKIKHSDIVCGIRIQFFTFFVFL